MQLGRVKAMLDHMEDRSAQGPWSHHLFGMKNIPFIKNVLATMGVALNVEAMCAHGIPLFQLKFYKFNASELHAAGFDLTILAAAGFTAEELMLITAAAAAARIAGKPNIFDAAASGDVKLVEDHCIADPACVHQRNR
jgi:hypothetical protein